MYTLTTNIGSLVLVSSGYRIQPRSLSVGRLAPGAFGGCMSRLRESRAPGVFAAAQFGAYLDNLTVAPNQ